MAIVEQLSAIRPDVVEQLRDMARCGVPLAEMVGRVQGELVISQDFIVPVMAYFCKAFSLPLRDVLPLREWCQTNEDYLVGRLMDSIKSWQKSV